MRSCSWQRSRRTLVQLLWLLSLLTPLLSPSTTSSAGTTTPSEHRCFEMCFLPAASFYAEHDFFGGYDHRKRAGLVHVANHHISPGVCAGAWRLGGQAQVSGLRRRAFGHVHFWRAFGSNTFHVCQTSAPARPARLAYMVQGRNSGLGATILLGEHEGHSTPNVPTLAGSQPWWTAASPHLCPC